VAIVSQGGALVAEHTPSRAWNAQATLEQLDQRAPLQGHQIGEPGLGACGLRQCERDGARDLGQLDQRVLGSSRHCIAGAAHPALDAGGRGPRSLGTEYRVDPSVDFRRAKSAEPRSDELQRQRMALDGFGDLHQQRVARACHRRPGADDRPAEHGAGGVRVEPADGHGALAQVPRAREQHVQTGHFAQRAESVEQPFDVVHLVHIVDDDQHRRPGEQGSDEVPDLQLLPSRHVELRGQALEHGRQVCAPSASTMMLSFTTSSRAIAAAVRASIDLPMPLGPTSTVKERSARRRWRSVPSRASRPTSGCFSESVQPAAGTKRYPSPTVTMCWGLAGSTSTFLRSRLMVETTVRVRVPGV